MMLGHVTLPQFVETKDPILGDIGKLLRVRIVLDSISPGNIRLLTWRITAPRVILAEINTHRALTRSSESSRAIPAKKRIGQVETTPYRPLKFGERVRGMGSGNALEYGKACTASAAWEYARRACVTAATVLSDLDLAKEELNRILEPWALCRTVLTGTDWANFFALRTHDSAHPVFRALARAMYVLFRKSIPKRLDFNEWHLPFTSAADVEAAERYTRAGPGCDGGVGDSRPAEFCDWPTYHLARWSAARCARVSYGLLDGRAATPEADDETWSKLVGRAGDPIPAAWSFPATFRPAGGNAYDAEPLHASPLESQATPMHPATAQMCPQLRSNLRGWVQFRKLFAGEAATFFAPPPEVADKWAADTPAEVFSETDLY